MGKRVRNFGYVKFEMPVNIYRGYQIGRYEIKVEILM